MDFLSKRKLPLIIYHHSAFIDHFIPRHPESPGRVAAITKALQKCWPSTMFREAPLCTDEHILRFHTESHLLAMKELFELAENAKKNGSKRQTDLMQMIDGDTVVMWGTREAAYRAAGSVVAAIDEVFQGSTSTAFCCVRPPGHHAERARACGFCFFNNAGIGAKHAQAVYGIQRVAVVDFDVHHGNGTEEGFAPDDTLFYGSTHQQYAFPGTGNEPELIGSDAACAIDRRIVNRYLTAGPTSKAEFRQKWKEVLSEMELFNPGLVIISAGFDAHENDPLADCQLNEEDFEWATAAVLESCRRICLENPPPCVSVLEGGYDLDALAASAVAHVKALAAGPPSIGDVGSSELSSDHTQMQTLALVDVKVGSQDSDFVDELSGKLEGLAVVDTAISSAGATNVTTSGTAEGEEADVGGGPEAFVRAGETDSADKEGREQGVSVASRDSS